jgi:hypothetical protein
VKPSGIALVILSCMLFLFTSLTFLVALVKLYQVVERATGRAVASTQVWMVNDFSIFFLCFSVLTSGIIRASYAEIKGLCLRKMVAKFLDRGFVLLGDLEIEESRSRGRAVSAFWSYVCFVGGKRFGIFGESELLLYFVAGTGHQTFLHPRGRRNTSCMLQNTWVEMRGAAGGNFFCRRYTW